MSLQFLPKQPNAETSKVQNSHPSLIIYLVLMTVAVGMILVGFSLQHSPDWAGLLLNLGSGFIGSVVVLIFVDRRLRSSEISTIRRLPAAGALRFKITVFPSHRIAFRYSRSLLVILESNLTHAIRLSGFADLDSNSINGFLLRGDPGSGKTMWTQLYAADSSRRYLDAEASGRVVVLVPLSRLQPNRSLYRTLFESVNNTSPCSEWAFKRLMRSGLVTVVLDGYDELFNQTSHLNA